MVFFLGRFLVLFLDSLLVGSVFHSFYLIYCVGNEEKAEPTIGFGKTANTYTYLKTVRAFALMEGNII